MPNEQQERHKRFDERFPQDRFGRIGRNPHNFAHNTNIKSFIDEEVALAKHNGKTEQLLELLQVFNDYEVPLTMTAQEVREIISNLIPKNK